MICFNERKNKQVRCNTEQSYSVINDALYIGNRRRLKNSYTNSNVFRAQRRSLELWVLNAANLMGGLQTATFHHLGRALTSDSETGTLHWQANPSVFIAYTAFLLLYCKQVLQFVC